MARKPARGRPQGSGINDARTLEKIAKLLANDPDLKPTTAIKAVGIDDPSSIRRLRDKLKSSSPTRKSKKPARKKSTVSAKPASKQKKKRAAKAVTARKAPAKKARAKKKTPAQKTVATRTATASAEAPRTASPRKTVPTRKAPGRSAPPASGAMPDFGFKNPFADMANGMPLPTGFPGLDMETLISTTVEKQIQLYESALKFSPLANILRQQALMTDMMLTMLRTQKEFTKPGR